MDSDFNISGTTTITDISNLYDPSLTSNGGDYSHAEGGSSEAIGAYSHAEGNFTIAAGNASHAEGYYSIASRQYSHAEGFKTVTTGQYSHAEGSGSLASGIASHAEGRTTTASGDYSHVEGWRSIASGSHSHAEGSGSIAQGAFSHTAGNSTIALGQYQSVIGQFNVAFTSQSAFIIGDGTDNSNRRNVLFVSRSHFEVSASRTFLQGLSNTAQTNVLTYNPTTGQVYYTASSNVTGTAISVDVRNQGTTILSNPTFINFTGSGVTASVNGAGVNVFVPGGGGGSGTPSSPTNSIQFNNASAFGGSSNFTFNGTNIVNLTGSLITTGSQTLTGSMFVSGAISASYGENTVGFYGTASWAVSASQAISSSYSFSSSYALSASYVENAASSSYPIRITGSTLYSVGPSLITPTGNGTIGSVFLGNEAAIGGETAKESVLIGPGAGNGAGIAEYIVAIGSWAGSTTSYGQYSNYIGYNAGQQTYNSYNNNFIGRLAGGLAYYVHDSQFIGNYAGGEAENASFSIFIGNYAGEIAKNASSSIFLGNGAGSYSDNAGSSIFIGNAAGGEAKNASSSIFLGNGAGYWAKDAVSSILIGNGAGLTPNGGNLSINRNNIIIGNSITLPPGVSNSINIGGLIFGSGSLDTSTLSSGSSGGKIGINVTLPSYSLHVSGTVAFPDLTNTAQTNIVTIDTSTGQLFYTASSNIGGGGGSGVTINNNTNNNLVTATGTSNTLDGEANLTFDGSALKVVGNVTASSFTGSFTGSLLGTASYADYATTASAVNVTVSSNADEFLPVIIAYTGSTDGAKLAYIDSGFNFNPSTNALYLPSNGATVIGNTTIQSSVATFGSSTNQNHVVHITGSFNVSKSLNVVGSMSLNTIPTASFHISGTTILNGGNLIGLPFSSFTTVPTQITGNTGIRGILYVYPRSGDTSSVIFGGGGYQSWTLRSLGFNDFQIRSTSNENATPGPQVTLMHFSSGSNGEFRIGVLNETPEYTFDISGSARVTSSFYLPGLTTIPQSNVLTIDTTTGQVYYTASSAFASTDSNIFKGTQTFSGSLIPAGPYIDNTSSYNLGSPTAAWDKIYVSNNSLHFVSGSTSSSIGFNNGIISFNNATVTIPTGSTIPYTSTSSIIGDGINASYDINHGFNTRNLHITVYENFDNYETVYPDIRRINANTASIVFANPVSAINQYVVYISQ